MGEWDRMQVYCCIQASMYGPRNWLQLFHDRGHPLNYRLDNPAVITLLVK